MKFITGFVLLCFAIYLLAKGADRWSSWMFKRDCRNFLDQLKREDL